ncbi:serine hydrolase domain-containing protein [Flavobacterium psychrotrophum]|uniref:serine hydrolase domain-containing protein n=1 Tax=Flavobacterium psychrotrophum TaxID=2294119 RepID=UPI000E320F18|nr:serine hydrolase domain-containing protein [Flavobacterium psychrotrophum]
MNKSLLLATLFAGTFIAHAQDNFKPIDSIVKTYESKNGPGLSVRILKDGKTVYNNHAGYANLEKNTKITDESVFNLGSTSKQFTAACIVLLQQQGKLNLNGNLRKYIPEFPAYAEKITLLHLLTHTSGLKDFLILATIQGDESEEYTNAQIKEMMVSLQPDFAPGEKWNYSNTGYWCLAQIVEKVSGKSIGEFARKNIFKPLGMKNTAYYLRPANGIKNKATGYAKKNNTYAPTAPDESAVGGAGVYSTLGDLEKWLVEMQKHHLFGDAFWKAMTEDDAYKSEEVTYTKGLFISPYRSKTMIQHGGDVEGYHPFLGYFPEDKVGAIILTNDDNFKRNDAIIASVDNLLGFQYRYPSKTTETAPVLIPDFMLYSGNYILGENEYVLIEENHGRLVLTYLAEAINATLNPTADPHRFMIEGTSIAMVFSDIKDGKAQKIKSIEGEEITDFSRVEKMPENPAYKVYEGSYHCAGLKQDIKFFTKQGLLYIKLANNKTDWIIHTEGEDFGTKYGEISFKKDASGTVTGFMYNHERAKNLEFVKQ